MDEYSLAWESKSQHMESSLTDSIIHYKLLPIIVAIPEYAQIS